MDPNSFLDALELDRFLVDRVVSEKLAQARVHVERGPQRVERIMELAITASPMVFTRAPELREIDSRRKPKCRRTTSKYLHVTDTLVRRLRALDVCEQQR